MNIRVDEHADPVAELRRIFNMLLEMGRAAISSGYWWEWTGEGACPPRACLTPPSELLHREGDVARIDLAVAVGVVLEFRFPVVQVLRDERDIVHRHAMVAVDVGASHVVRRARWARPERCPALWRRRGRGGPAGWTERPSALRRRRRRRREARRARGAGRLGRAEGAARRRLRPTGRGCSRGTWRTELPAWGRRGRKARRAWRSWRAFRRRAEGPARWLCHTAPAAGRARGSTPGSSRRRPARRSARTRLRSPAHRCQ